METLLLTNQASSRYLFSKMGISVSERGCRNRRWLALVLWLQAFSSWEYKVNQSSSDHSSLVPPRSQSTSPSMASHSRSMSSFEPRLASNRQTPLPPLTRIGCNSSSPTIRRQSGQLMTHSSSCSTGKLADVCYNDSDRSEYLWRDHRLRRRGNDPDPPCRSTPGLDHRASVGRPYGTESATAGQPTRAAHPSLPTFDSKYHTRINRQGCHAHQSQQSCQVRYLSRILRRVKNTNETILPHQNIFRGHSAVRIELLDGLLNLLNLSITPLVPLRGTISASGDLAPLAYVAGALCAHPDVYVIDRSLQEPKILSSAECLKAHGISPIVLGPKEGLAIANGTAFSAAAASIAIFHSHILGLLSQVLTAMTVEAMVGQIGAFHPFIHQTARPHPGQVEVAENIYRLLETSKLLSDQQAQHDDVERERSKQILRQDRYPLRTAPQWIGPQLEDLLVAHQTISIELNSTTDNPLVDFDNGILHHGGNFQAASIATSMEKTRLAIAAIGKIMFAQVTELNKLALLFEWTRTNSFINKGLPSCLNGHKPSTNYHTKGLDTSCAAYCSELQYLAGPVTTHVQSAEGHNQAINSLAFISARKTLEAIEILKMLMASHLYCLCQALDLRVFELRFKNMLGALFSEAVADSFGSQLSKGSMEGMVMGIIDRFWSRRETTAALDTEERVRDGLECTVSVIVEAFELEKKQIPVGSVERFFSSSAKLIIRCLASLRTQGLDHHTVDYLGGSRPLYEFVRGSLGVRVRQGDVVEEIQGPTIGGMVDRIFCSLQFERLPAHHPQQFLGVLLSLFPSPSPTNR
ncbi:phenylalanine ammonia-lyase [Puccinia sorghi]|uniref:Phenylalanine ammonia-lyase n=1 Tax=Puccinia sorghi TaxID=27349 RepID=A0A0L6VQY6_9BASI|nr:phenylalanine ammonia-lyase [Puccinia sorghi]